MMIKSTLPCTVVAACLVVSACATDQQKTEGQGAGAGALLGALIGVAITHDARGAAIGGAVGGGAGYAVGNQVAQRKAQYAQRENDLRNSAQRANVLAEQTQQMNQQISAQVARLDETVRSLRKQEMSEDTRRGLTESNRRQAASLLNGVNAQLQVVRDEVARQQALLAAETQQAQQSKESTDSEGVHLVSAGIRELQSNQRQLEEARAQLQLIDPRRAY